MINPPVNIKSAAKIDLPFEKINAKITNANNHSTLLNSSGLW
jgi:hypothetical protein